ncbi:hypothetical protein [Marinicrinis lubricantis]|uniref:Uncharacterized protein n=1 Tax=Marinicrinis lubricantis TaxID=2086470 RepID=A0ABW1IU87_9BACL
MTNDISIVSLLLFMMIVVMLSRRAYFSFLRRVSAKTLRRIGLSLDELDFVLHGLIYYLPIPSHDPDILASRLEELHVHVQLKSWLYPSVLGVRVSMKMKSGKEITAAYLNRHEYRAALLDRFSQEGRISDREYEWIASAHLIQEQTKEQIRQHVYEEIHNRRYL